MIYSFKLMMYSLKLMGYSLTLIDISLKLMKLSFKLNNIKRNWYCFEFYGIKKPLRLERFDFII